MSGSDAFDKKYILEKIEIGSGATAVVMVCRSKDSGEEYAVKIVNRNGELCDEKQLRREVVIMQKLDHPNIIRLVDFFETEGAFLLVLELAEGGELFEKILDQRVFTEAHAQKIARQLFEALAYMHQKGIAHRDLKPENIMFKSDEVDSEVKIVDFGFAISFKTTNNSPVVSGNANTPGVNAVEKLAQPNPRIKNGHSKENKENKTNFSKRCPESEGKDEVKREMKRIEEKKQKKHRRMTTKLGTQGYAAPEVFHESDYNETCDVWSIGIIVYILLSGMPPFIPEDDQDECAASGPPFWVYVNQMQQDREKLKLEFPAKNWKNVSLKALLDLGLGLDDQTIMFKAQDFLRKLLILDPKSRPPAETMLLHPWVCTSPKAPEGHTTHTAKLNASLQQPASPRPSAGCSSRLGVETAPFPPSPVSVVSHSECSVPNNLRIPTTEKASSDENTLLNTAHRRRLLSVMTGYKGRNHSPVKFGNSLKKLMIGIQGRVPSDLMDPGNNMLESSDDDAAPIFFEEKYELKNLQLGAGKASVAMLCTNKETKEEFAVVILEKKAVDGSRPAIKRFRTLKTIQHTHLVKTVDTFQTTQRMFIVSEMCWGGDLLERMVVRRWFSEQHTRTVIKQVLSAIEYLHSKDIVHGEVTPGKILFADSKDLGSVRLNAFTLPGYTDKAAANISSYSPWPTSSWLKAEEEDKCTPSRSDDKPADMWSLGVLAYTLICGSLPFSTPTTDGEDSSGEGMPFWMHSPLNTKHPEPSFWMHTHTPRNTKHPKSLSSKYEFKFVGKAWDFVSSGAKDFIRKMLEVDPQRRLTASEALAHRWIVDKPLISEVASVGDKKVDGVSVETREGDILHIRKRKMLHWKQRNKMAPNLWKSLILEPMRAPWPTPVSTPREASKMSKTRRENSPSRIDRKHQGLKNHLCVPPNPFLVTGQDETFTTQHVKARTPPPKTKKQNIFDWNEHDVSEWVSTRGVSPRWKEYAKKCLGECVDGVTLHHAGKEALVKIGFSEIHADALLGERKLLCYYPPSSQTPPALGSQGKRGRGRKLGQNKISRMIRHNRYVKEGTGKGEIVLVKALMWKRQKLGWGTRVFKLTPSSLEYYRPSHNGRPELLGTFELGYISKVYAEKDSSLIFRIEIASVGRKTLRLRACSEEQRSLWIRAIDEARSRVSKKTPKVGKFWKNNQDVLPRSPLPASPPRPASSSAVLSCPRPLDGFPQKKKSYQGTALAPQNSEVSLADSRATYSTQDTGRDVGVD